MSSSITTECNCRISEDFDILRRMEVFSSAPAEVIKLFAYFAKHRIYQPGETILRQGNKADSCFFIIRGKVTVSATHKEQDIILQQLGSGAFFGELALLARFEWFFSVKAIEETELVITDRESFQRILEKYPERRERITEKIIQLRISRFENQTAYLLDKLIASGVNTEIESQPFII